ncbi:glutamate N-acetyltransferase [Entomophthora muscae]|uniref:Glutamate N-acetyltransferase n=1 Tax=Entomophthora muscae TaxID=34485 RepID=A0ACC2SZJ5_9FUNG|nr:glutamate N-acetyltransferase [Entomophthora muscae]
MSALLFSKKVMSNLKNSSTQTSFLRKISQSSLPEGFKASGVHAGIKKAAEKRDIALIFSEKPCVAAAVFTQNKFCAAPVQICKRILETRAEFIHSLVINSGCANAVTGEKGLENARKMVSLADEATLGKDESRRPSSLVMSTGVIGHHLPMEKIEAGIREAASHLENTPESWLRCAEGFMTTDTRPKLRAFSSKNYRMVGISKGAGMIHPNMATLLSMVATDASITQPCLDAALKYATERSFNSISIDGDTSTNDTCIVIANGTEATKISDINSSEYQQFQEELTTLMIELAQLIIKDAEGATKFVTVEVKNADSFASAKHIASTICTSALVKTALYGQDANWGRIACAIGYSGIKAVDPHKVSLSMLPPDGSSALELLRNGEPIHMDETRASEVMAHRDIHLAVDLGIGSDTATMWTCDFSHEYVTINGSYRS